jgi:hypothetical protein
MTKLEFDWDSRHNESRAEYRGLTIRAVQEEQAPNPWQDWDGNVPLIWTSGDGLNDDAQGEDIESPLSSKSPAWISRHWPELVRIVAPEYAPDVLASEALEEYGRPAGEAKRSKLEELLAEDKPSGRYGCWSQACTYFDKLEALWTMLGVPALDFQRNGYSQGDSVRGLLVATPAWQKKLGACYTSGDELKSQADLFGAWAFGDVYYFVIEDSEGELLDSCGGYYGTDFGESGLAESAKESADAILEAAAKRKADKLKELIRNRVPLALRPALLEEAGALG